MIAPLLYVILSIVPATIVALIIDAWHRFHYYGRRAPVSDKLLRPPGESCRQKVEELNGRILELTIWVVIFPSTFLLLFVSLNGTSMPGHHTIKVWLPSLALGFFTVALMTLRLINLFKERNNWRIGFSGERAVGELLNQLMADGCRVCHDFPLSDKWNIDHIVVAPSGVYAIETKTKRKGPASSQQQAHEVIYDGKALEFPFYSSDEDLAQAREQAARLSKFLATELKAPQPVTPVITLPGWYVINRGKGDVVVANPKLLDREILTHEAPVLSPDRIRDIARILEHKCRDVEF
jgi:hypothetical protein